MGPIVLLIGLGIHSIFEGLALGMSENFQGTLLFSIAICMHKGAAAISLGISLTKTFPNKDSFILKLLIVFSMFTPTGVILGCVLETGSKMVEILFSCLAAGSFLYISCSEVIVEEFSQNDYKGWKLFSYGLGIASICGLILMGGHEHESEEGGEQ